MMDFSLAIILAYIKGFCACGLDENLNRTYQIVTSAARKEYLVKTIVQICLAQVMSVHQRESAENYLKRIHAGGRKCTFTCDFFPVLRILGLYVNLWN